MGIVEHMTIDTFEFFRITNTRQMMRLKHEFLLQHPVLLNQMYRPDKKKSAEGLLELQKPLSQSDFEMNLFFEGFYQFLILCLERLNYFFVRTCKLRA